MPAPTTPRLTASFHRIEVENATRLVEQHYGGNVSSVLRLATERDDSFRLDLDGNTVVAKFAHPLDDPAVLHDQLAVLDALDREHDDLPVPGVVPSRDGSLLVTVDDSTAPRLLRVLEFRAGETLGTRPRAVDDLAVVAALHARLARAIADIGDRHEPPLQGAATPWNLLAIDEYTELLDRVVDFSMRSTLTEVLDRLRVSALPRLRVLPLELAHNDVHGDNVLVHSEPFRVTGLLDFGDMTRTPRVADVAVAASYARGHVASIDDPWAAARAYVAGYESERPLSPLEHELLPELVLLRLAQRGILNSAIAASNPAAAPYASRNLSVIARDVRELAASIPNRIGGGA